MCFSLIKQKLAFLPFKTMQVFHFWNSEKNSNEKKSDNHIWSCPEVTCFLCSICTPRFFLIMQCLYQNHTKMCFFSILEVQLHTLCSHPYQLLLNAVWTTIDFKLLQQQREIIKYNMQHEMTANWKGNLPNKPLLK